MALARYQVARATLENRFLSILYNLSHYKFSEPWNWQHLTLASTPPSDVEATLESIQYRAKKTLQVTEETDDYGNLFDQAFNSFIYARRDPDTAMAEIKSSYELLMSHIGNKLGKKDNLTSESNNAFLTLLACEVLSKVMQFLPRLDTLQKRESNDERCVNDYTELLASIDLALLELDFKKIKNIPYKVNQLKDEVGMLVGSLGILSSMAGYIIGGPTVYLTYSAAILFFGVSYKLCSEHHHHAHAKLDQTRLSAALLSFR
jgi:hypothetical protein